MKRLGDLVKSTLKIEVILVSGLVLGLFTAPGCALFKTHPEVSGPENSGFHRTASTNTNPVPLPVEIVTDISMIASGYGTQQDGAWKPVYPEVNLQNSPTPPNGAAPAAPAGLPEPMVAEETAVTTPDPSPEVPQNAIATRPKRRAASSGKSVDYVVKQGDTLMKISFEKYGNVYRWREIYDTNRTRIPNFNNLTAGSVLTIQGVEYVVITKNGVPYLIRRGDTLGKISKNVYGVQEKWRSIWKNNPELIQNPNKIYAGFTLYYVPAPGSTKVTPVRQVSSEPKNKIGKAAAPAVQASATNPPLTPATAEAAPPQAPTNAAESMVPNVPAPEESTWVPADRR